MAHKKFDQTRTDADQPLSALTLKRLVDNITDINERRMLRGASYKWDLTNPPLWGSTVERWTPLFLPIDPETRTIRLRLRYECSFASVNVRASLILGPHEIGDPGSFVTLTTTATRTTSSWISVDVTEAQRRGLRTVQIALRIESEASADTKTLQTVFASDRQEFLATVEDPLSFGTAFNASDVCSLEFLDSVGTKTIDWPSQTEAQTIRMHASGQLYTWPKPPLLSRTVEDAAKVKLTRYGQLQVYSIEWEQVEGGPYLSGRPTFPWADEAQVYQGLEPGRGGSAERVGRLYQATEILAGHRTPAYCVAAAVPGGQVPSSWGGADNNMLQYPNNTFKTGTGWETLCGAAIGEDISISGAAGSLERRLLQVSLFVLPLADSPAPHTFEFRCQTWAGGSGTAQHSSTEVEVDIDPIGPFSQQHYIHRFKVAGGAYGDYTPRNNMHGQFDLALMGRLGVREVLMYVKDTSGTRPKMLTVQAKTDPAPGRNWSVITVGLIVRPVPSRQWTLVGV